MRPATPLCQRRPVIPTRQVTMEMERKPTYHQTNLKIIWSDTHQYLDLAKEVVIERGHPVVVRDAREKVHENELRIPLASVAWLLVTDRLRIRTTLDDDNCWRPLAINRCQYPRSIKWARIKLPETHHNDQHTPSPYSRILVLDRRQHSSSAQGYQTGDRPRVSLHRYPACSASHRRR